MRRKIDEYEMTGAQKKTHAYKLMDSQKTREFEVTGAQKKTHAYNLMDSQKTREYNLKGAQKTDEYENTESTTKKVNKKRVCKTVHVSECKRMTELK